MRPGAAPARGAAHPARGAAAGAAAGAAPPARAHQAAARSHEANARYELEMERGLAALALRGGGGGGGVGGEGKEAEVRGKGAAGSRAGARASSPAAADGPALALERGALSRQFRAQWRSAGEWSRGPRNPSGMLLDASDQPLLCAALSADGREAVVGGSDHGLRVYDTASGKEKRNLFTKRFGHREWVTCCSFLPDGQVLSAGMDSKLCLWRGAQCADLEGHRGSISRAQVAEDGRYAVSASYDKTVRVWDLSKHREVACLAGHKSPVQELAFSEGLLISGARDGVALAWDLTTGGPAPGPASVPVPPGGAQHEGHVTALLALPARAFCSGDQQGTVRMWDLRAPAAPRAAALHPGGAVNELRAAPDGKIVSAGADKRIAVLDPRRIDQPLRVLAHHKDFIYSLAVTDRHVLSGAGDGMVLVHDLCTGRLCYGLGANAAGVRAIECGADHFLAAGDDGKAILYHFD
jgi:WD40 repeat protein